MNMNQMKTIFLIARKYRYLISISEKDKLIKLILGDNNYRLKYLFEDRIVQSNPNIKRRKYVRKYEIGFIDFGLYKQHYRRFALFEKYNISKKVKSE